MLLVTALANGLRADGPADNKPDSVRRVPKLGIEVPAAKREVLETGLKKLAAALATLEASKDQRIRDLLPDVRTYYRAVHDALAYREFFRESEIDAAVGLLDEGIERARLLRAGKAPWATKTGLLARGYRSRIDGSAQPYGLVVPDSYSFEGTGKVRLDVWFHGRGETLSEVNFLHQRTRRVGQFAPPDTIVLHPYGRYSNAFKFAGEVDVLEAIESVRARYRIDPERISVRGFSMGGAACWQFAVHYADRWFAANPGAGFSETPEFLRFFQKETLTPTWYERKLWRMYDCVDWAANLSQCPTVAYSGEIDIQKQAADIMEQALEKEGIDLVHIIGPKTAHRYHPEAAKEVERRFASIARKGRERFPRRIRFVTYTLKYDRMGWVTVDGMGTHWERARVDGRLGDDSTVELKTENVTDLTLALPSGWSRFEITRPVRVSIDGQRLEGPHPMSDRSWTTKLHRTDGAWRLGARKPAGLRKRHDLQGPIDDAFMDSFLFVRPTGKANNEAVEKWARSELDRAIVHWRRHFRGDARVKDDSEVTDADIADSNLVLWGDPKSNAILKRISDKLPITWNADGIEAGSRSFPSADHALILIYPNPLNPDRYVVLNSGFTYRDFAYLNNARQVPKLPDWAVVDLRTPPDSLWPGKVVDADFFDERWELKSPGDAR